MPKHLTAEQAPVQTSSWYIIGGLALIVAEVLLIFEIIRLRAKPRKTENALIHQSQELLSKAFQQNPLSVTVLSVKDGRYIDVNETFERFTGWSREDVVGRTAFDIGLPPDPEASVDNGKLLLSGDAVRNLEVQTRTKNGEIRTSLASTESIELNGEPCVIVVTADITQLKRAEAVGSAIDIKERTETLSMVNRKLIEAHEEERVWLARELHDDISQRLCLLQVRFGNLKGTETSPVELRHGIEHAMQEVSNLAADVQGLSHRLHSSNLKSLGLAKAAGAYCEEVADQHKVQIDFRAENMPGDLSPEISLSIFRVLQEALRNAIKHSSSERFEVSLNHSSNEIHLTVHDSGRGFDAAEAMKGPGLGLTSMKERVTLVGGALSIESQPQKGTTVYVRVPLRPVTKSAHAPGSNRAGSAE
jgi:PAS domain S-box-containing protein